MKKILVIDDEPGMRAAVRLMLGAAGYAILEAQDAAAGLALAAEQVPDLVLCDMCMPVSNGLEVLKGLRAHPATAAIPFILMTGQDDGDAMRRSMLLGADDFLRKPFTLQSLVASVETRLRRREAQEQSAREVKERLVSIIEASSDLVLMVDVPHMTVTYANPAAASALEMDPAPGAPRGLLPDWMPAEAALRFTLEVLPAALQHGRWLGETALLTPAGREIPVRLQVRAHQGPGGQLDYLSLAAHDLSESRQAQQALRESEERMRAITTEAYDAILMMDASGNISFWNPAAQRIFGYPAEEALGQSLHRMLAPARHHPAFHRELPGFVATGQGPVVGKTLELSGLRKDGAEFPIELSLSSVCLNGQWQAVGMVRDVSERNRAAAELAALHRRNDLILNSLQEGILQLDLDGCHTLVNQAAARMLGWPPGELAGQASHKLWHHTHSDGRPYPREECQIYATLHDGLVRNVSNEVFWRRDGASFPVEYTSTPIRQGNELTGVAVIFRDISDKKRAEAEREQMAVQLLHAQKLESIGQLAAGIAHEINTPTQYIGDNTQFLQGAFADLARLLEPWQQFAKSPPSPEALAGLAAGMQTAAGSLDAGYLLAEIPKAIEQTLEGVERVAKIVRALKEFSHPSGEGKVPVDLNHAIESTLTVATNEWKYVADLKTGLDPRLPMVPCLPGEFNQVILNLVINAAHAIGDTLAASKAAGRAVNKGTISVSTRAVDSWVEIRVADTGPGIPPAIQHRVFDPFFTTKPLGKGTGQGLAIARSVVVDKHQGTLTFETEAGRGTTFIIRLPLNPPEPDLQSEP